ncbi:NCK-interacting protein with SH3 domain isoform X1 [Hydra vulgaris]|uniref:NCK-interacting protein with SH3 domain isoform X1 n=1 Tax=Hydra vulgaris TaxID=6087 RepID=UPI001F5EEBF8|nr:NCK-interacting protein with SH3 domain isoform X1 [Hydra vulgaris]XP_047139624.1 NCK-interacting protein with SH3 domain isoform X1 [Hydra vulgaris]
MYKSVYAFNGDQNEDVLKFNKGCLFNLLEQVDEHWWIAANEDGYCGLVPASYLEINKVSPDDVILSIGKSIQGIHKLAVHKSNGLDAGDLHNLQKLSNNSKIISQGTSLWSGFQTPQGRHLSGNDQSSVSVQVPQKIKSDTVRKGKSPKRYSAPQPPTQSNPNLQQNLQKCNEIKISTENDKSNDIHRSGSYNTVDLVSKESSTQSNTHTKCSQTTTLLESSQPITKLPDSSQSISEKGSQKSSVNSLITCNSNNFSSPQTSLANATSTVVPNDLGKKLVDGVRSKCKISFNKSLIAVRYVLNQLGKDINSFEELFKNIQAQIEDDKLSDYHGSLAAEDMNHLIEILDKLVKHKEDSQQRNWSIREDFSDIQKLLSQLIETLDEIDPCISCKILQDDEYRYLCELVIYYQMESRSKLRVYLLSVFERFCNFGQNFVSQLLCTVLPTEIAASMMREQNDLILFLKSSLVLTMLFSTGEPVPYHHYTQLNEAFVNFLLDLIENPPQNDEQVSDSLLGLILSFNKHFRATKHNPIMQVLSRRTVFRMLSEKLMLLFNRETDPVALFSFSISCPDSVLKFLNDIFSTKRTSTMFYTSDMSVMIEIILRQLFNRPSKDQVRTEYLSLFHAILTSDACVELKKHTNELKRYFENILTDYANESDVDVYIVREITNRFPDLFC